MYFFGFFGGVSEWVFWMTKFYFFLISRDPFFF